MRPIKCPVCGESCIPFLSKNGGTHEKNGCWWTRGCVWQGNAKPERLTLWERIKKHGLKARIF